MIQDSINQMLATAAVATKFAAGGVQDARAAKMGKLQAQKAEHIEKNLDPTKTEAMVDPKGKIDEAQALQKKIDKLGNKKLFPSKELAQTASQEHFATNKAVSGFQEGFSPEARRAFNIQTPSEVEAEMRQRAINERTQRLLSGVQNRQAPKSFRQALREQAEEKMMGGN